MAKTPENPIRRSSTRSEQAEARRQQIVDAALELFAQQGYSATTTKSIAQAVGVTEGLIFHYFPTKGDLLRVAAGQRSMFVRRYTISSTAPPAGRPVTSWAASSWAGWRRSVTRRAW